MIMERKLKRFNILLDDESLLYFPGSFLTGKVLLELDENTPATGLYFHIIGEGVVRFMDKRSKKCLASDRENYIDFRMRLLGDGHGEEEDDEDDDESDEVDDNTSSSDDDRDRRGKSNGRRRGRDLASTDDDDDDDNRSDGDTNSTVRQQDNKQAKILVLSPGVHTFPFKLGLPANLPSTFLGLNGWVQYFCRAILREPSGLVHKNQQVFIIINPIDLNQEPANLQQPFYCEAEELIKSKAFFPFPKSHKQVGQICCRVRLDRGGYVPGENILVSASIENASKLTIKRTRAILTETVEYKAKNKIIQAETRELASIERGKIAPKSTDIWKKEQLHIPALPPTNLRGCHLIKIHYDVYFEIITNKTTTTTSTSNATSNANHKSQAAKEPIRLQLPIVMATYPIRNRDGTLKRRKGAQYPDSLPIFRPWMDSSMRWKSNQVK